MKDRKCNRALLERSLTPDSARWMAYGVATLFVLLFPLTPRLVFGNGALQSTTAPSAKASSQAGTSAETSGSAQSRPQPKASQSSAGSALAQPETRPLHDRQIEGLVAGGVNSGRIALLVDKRGIDFTPTVRFLRELMDAGADDVLIQAIIKARQTLTTLPPCPINLPVWQTRAAADLAPEPANTSAGSTAADGSPISPELQQRLGQDLEHASDLEQRHSWREAEETYRDALKLDADSAAAHLGLAAVLSAEQRWADAVAEYRQALRLEPKNPQAHRGLGAALAARHDPDGSIAEYREAVLLSANDAELQAELGAALYANGELDAAISAYRAALALKPGDAQIANSLGIALYAAGEMDGAIAAYRQAVRLDPKDAEAHNNLGDALLHEGDRRAALEEYHRAFELAPNGSTLGNSYAAVLKQLGSP
jgi:tetratricopeptide (TPR) repeat protein